jgi:hypothetical protein
MPVHDWTRVRAGIFHDFHSSWITHLKEVLNGGLLPQGFYALSEQSAGETGPDVLTLETSSTSSSSLDWSGPPAEGMIAVAERPPQVSFTFDAEAAVYAAKRRTLAIRHVSDHRIVALIEILSPGNKSKQDALNAFLDKAVSALNHGYHLLIVDLFPPGGHDPLGIHAALWAQIENDRFEAPPDKPLTLAAYSAGPIPTAYVEPIAVGAILPDMPLFLEPGAYVNVPLEQTCMAAWNGVPEYWQRVIQER